MARVDFHISNEEFCHLTFRQFAAMRERVVEREKRWDLRFGVQCATTANFSMNKDPDKPALEPYDFFATLEEPEPEPMSFKQIAAAFGAKLK